MPLQELLLLPLLLLCDNPCSSFYCRAAQPGRARARDVTVPALRPGRLLGACWQLRKDPSRALHCGQPICLPAPLNSHRTCPHSSCPNAHRSLPCRPHLAPAAAPEPAPGTAPAAAPPCPPLPGTALYPAAGEPRLFQPLPSGQLHLRGQGRLGAPACHSGLRIWHGALEEVSSWHRLWTVLLFIPRTGRRRRARPQPGASLQYLLRPCPAPSVRGCCRHCNVALRAVGGRPPGDVRRGAPAPGLRWPAWPCLPETTPPPDAQYLCKTTSVSAG